LLCPKVLLVLLSKLLENEIAKTDSLRFSNAHVDAGFNDTANCPSNRFHCATRVGQSYDKRINYPISWRLDNFLIGKRR